MVNLRNTLLTIAAFLLASSAQAVIIIDGSTTGYYNDGLGDQSALDGPGGVLVGPGEGDPVVGPIFSDPIAGPYPTAFGTDWLGGDYSGAGSTWSGPGTAIPSGWTVGSETAIVYEFTLGEISDLDIGIGVDNGILVWLDGDFLFGATEPGGASVDEYTIDVTGLAAGDHRLQLLRADHGGATGFIISVDATRSTEPPVLAPAPAPVMLLALGLLGLATATRRR